MEEMKRVKIPAFGYWDYCDEIPITQYFENAMQAGLSKGHFYGDQDDADAYDDDLFKVPVAPVYQYHNNRKMQKGGGGQKHHQQVKEQVKKQGMVYDLTTQSPRKPNKAPKAVDEDLYKIPPDLLYQKPKRKKLLRSLWSGCLGLNCIA